MTASPPRSLWPVLSGLAIPAIGVIVALFMKIDGAPSRCAMLYAETGDERYRDASWWTCYWAERQHLAKNSENIAKIAAANSAEQVERAQAARVKTEKEAQLIEELRVPVCGALAKWGHGAGYPDDRALEVDLVGLSGHGSIFALDAVCRQCADHMTTYYDATGARFCDSGGKAGHTCNEAKPFPHTGSVHREGTCAALMSEFGCT